MNIRRHGGAPSSRPSSTACRRPPSRRRSRSSTATAPSVCLRICCRRSATFSALTPMSAWTGRAASFSIRTGLAAAAASRPGRITFSLHSPFATLHSPFSGGKKGHLFFPENGEWRVVKQYRARKQAVGCLMRRLLTRAVLFQSEDQSYETIPEAAHTRFGVVRRLIGLRAGESAGGELSATSRFAGTTRRSERRDAEIHLRELENLSGHVARVLGLCACAIHLGQARLRLS